MRGIEIGPSAIRDDSGKFFLGGLAVRMVLRRGLEEKKDMKSQSIRSRTSDFIDAGVRGNRKL